MSIKYRIWALPVIATAIFVIGLATSVYFSTTAITSINTTENIDYPVLDKTKVISADVRGLVDMLKEAVSEGDKKRLDSVAEGANKVREEMKALSQVPGQTGLSEKLSKETLRLKSVRCRVL